MNDSPDPGTDPSHAPPIHLVEAAQRGDAMAMNDLLDLITPHVSALCGPIALEDSADAVQESLIAVFRGIRRLRDPLALYAWVRTTTLREAMRVARRAERETPADVSELPAAGRPELATDIWDVLERLSPEHRAILMPREVEGLDEKSAGAMLNISTGTVKSRLHRARQSFRRAWMR